MLTGLTNFVRGLIGGNSPAAGPAGPLLPAAETGGDVTRAFGRDVVIADPWRMPWRGALDLDSDGNETADMRLKYREAFRREPAVRAAVRGKVNSVASLDVSIIPAGKTALDAAVAEFVKYAIDSSEHGAHGLIRNIVQPAIIDGFSLSEKKLAAVEHGRWRGKWGLAHARQLDTLYLRLRLDEFRNVEGVVNLRRGVQVYDPRKTLLFTYSGMHSNPFGQSDLRACFRSIGLIEDAYKMWYVAIKRFGLPYMVGKVGQPQNRKKLEEAMQELKAGGYIVTTKDDEIDLMDLASAAGFGAFESKVNKLREEIFLAVRGAYLPFLEGQGGTDSHGDTEVHKVASDADEYLLAKDAALVINRQLIPDLVYPNFGTEVDLPRAVVGGTNWAETRAQLEVGAMLLNEFKLPLSREQTYEVAQWAPPDGDDDAVKPPDAGGPPGAPPPGGPEGGPPGPGGDGVGGTPAAPQSLAAATPPAAPASPAPSNPAPAAPASPAPASPGGSAFSADRAGRYAEYFMANQHGHYPGDMHEQFGMGVAAFADATGLMRKQVRVRGVGPAWAWANKPEVEPEPEVVAPVVDPAADPGLMTAAGDEAGADVAADLDPADLEAIAAAETFAAPGAAPRAGLVWHEATHRWRRAPEPAGGRDDDRGGVDPGVTGRVAPGDRRGGGAEPEPAAAPAAEPGRLGKARAAAAAKLSATRGGRAVLALGAKGLKAFHAVEHRLLYAMKKVEDLAGEAARERGMPPDRVEKLKRTLYAADFLGGYATGAAAAAIGLPIWAVKATMLGPSASVLYLAYSTARNPAATWRAAKALVSSAKAAAHHADAAGGTPRDLAAGLADYLRDAADPDAAVAVYAAALAETGDAHEALALAAEALAGQAERLADYAEEDHPRDDKGRFVKKGDMKAARTDPKLAAALRARVTNPAERAKLDRKLGTAAVTSPPSGSEYNPDPAAVNPHTGLPDKARVGVPAMSVPPPPAEIGRLPNLSKKQRKVESRYADAYLADPDGMARKYLRALAKGKVGVERNVFATDDVKALNPDWNPGRVRPGEKLDAETQEAMAKYNTAVHQTANALAKRAFLTYLDETVAKLPPEKRTVLVTNGGCAAGKGSSLARAEDPASPYAGVLPAAQQVGAVWDAAGEQNATENEWVLQACRERGITPIFAYVYADPKDTWEAPDRGVIRRAVRKGRMVDARLFADSYALGAKNMHAFHQKHKDDGTRFIFLDNRKKGAPAVMDGVPPAALEWDADAIYKGAVASLEKNADRLPKALVKGGLAGGKIWGAA